MSRDNSQPIATPERVLDEMHLTEKWLLDVLDQRALLEGEPPLQASLAMRAPSINALSVLQLRALREMRAGPTAGDGDGDPWRRAGPGPESEAGHSRRATPGPGYRTRSTAGLGPALTVRGSRASAARPASRTPHVRADIGYRGVMDRLHFIGTATTVITLGSFTLLTDPNFLRRGQRAYLGWGLSSRRLTDPALAPEDLPALDAVVLSHLHGDHFDRVSRERLDRHPPVLTTPHAVRRLDRWGFTTAPLDTWEQHTLRKDGEELVVTSLPAIHARGVLGKMLPPVMGSMLEHRADGAVRRRVYLSGDTLTGDHVDQVTERFPDIDAAVVHLGGTRVLFRTVTMDEEQGVDFVERCRPSVVVPVHYDDYGVFRSPLSAFVDRAHERRLSATLRSPRRGDTVSLDPLDATT